MAAQDDGGQEGLHRLHRLDHRRLRLEPGVDVDEAGRHQTIRGLLGRGEGPGIRPRLTQVGEHLLDPGHVAEPAALGDQPATRSQHGGQVPEEGVVVGYPVERGRREDRVDRAEAQRLGQIALHELHPVAEGRQSPGRLDQHGRGGVHRDHPSTGQALQQLLGHPTAAAAGVEHRLVALQRQPVQHGPAPPGLGIGDPVVGGAVPVAGGRRGYASSLRMSSTR